MFEIAEYGEKFEIYLDAVIFLADRFEWKYGRGEEVGEVYNKEDWIESRIKWVEKE